MKTYRTGSAASAVIIGLVVVVGLGTIYYFVSDVFRTKVNSATDQYTHWTPENIAKDPVNYLNFCEAETNKAIDGLKADNIAVAQNKAKLEGMRDEAKRKIDIADNALTELKGLYTKNDTESATWPVTWTGGTIDSKAALQTQIVTLFKQSEIQKSLLAKVEGGLKTLDAQVAKIAEAQGKAQEQLSDISANRELLKVNALTSDLTNRLVAMKATVQATVDTASQSNGTISLDQLSAQAAAAPPSNAEFDKIMSKVK